MRSRASASPCLAVLALALAVALSHLATATLAATPPRSHPKHFWMPMLTAREAKRRFDHVVASQGGAVDPTRNFFPKGFGALEPHRGAAWRHKHVVNRGNLIRHQRFHGAPKAGTEHPRRGKLVHHPAAAAPHGCEDSTGFHFEGDTWYSRGCRRHKCLHFRGNYFVETDSCDTEIYNTTYKCIIEVNLEEDYPSCCPKYVCNPDNLGNRINA